MANYTISVINGEITVTDNGSPIGADLLDEGTDTVTGIEALGFVDGAIGVSLVTHTPTIEPVGDEFQVNNYTNFHQEFTAVAALADGGFVLTWSSDGQDQGGNTPAVVAQRFNADGTAAAPEFIVNSTLFNVQTSPDVTALGDGGFVITWQSNDQDGDDWGIYSPALRPERKYRRPRDSGQCLHVGTSVRPSGSQSRQRWLRSYMVLRIPGRQRMGDLRTNLRCQRQSRWIEISGQHTHNRRPI